jgi:hypothetical protein
MTPSFLGRFQTRLVLTLLVGLPIGLYFANLLPIFLMLLFGFFWDTIYNFLQSKRWDRDWPPIFMAIGGLGEAVLIYIFINQVLKISSVNYFWMYNIIWIIMFILQLGILNIFFPYRRHKAARMW